MFRGFLQRRFLQWRLEKVHTTIMCVGRLLRNPFKKSTRVLLIVWAAEERTILVETFLLDFAVHARRSMTTFWFCYRSHITPYPIGTRIRLIGTQEEGSAIGRFQYVFDHTHSRQLLMAITSRMRLFR